MRKSKGRARILAVLLSACMLVQPVMGVYAAELPTMQEGGSAEQLDPSVTATTETTATPTPEASVEPTEEPAGEETETTEPTTEPSIEPTTEPSTEPTEMPTVEPEESPSTEPEEDPTGEPTETPSAEPTALPEAIGNADLVTSGEDANSLMEVNLDMQSGTVNITLKEGIKQYLPRDLYVWRYTTGSSYDEGHEGIWVEKDQEQVSYDMRYFINKSGTYYVGVSFYDNATQSSYSVYSEKVKYTRPSKCMESPSEVKWDGNIATWSPVEGAIGYRVDLYNQLDGTSTSFQNLDENTTQYDFGGILENYANGSYYFTVIAVSANVTETANSEAAGSDINKIEKECYEVSQCNASGETIGEPVKCTNLDAALNKAKELEGEYKKIKYTVWDNYIYENDANDDILTIPDVGGPLFLQGVDTYGNSVINAKKLVVNSDVILQNMSITGTGNRNIDYQLNDNCTLTVRNNPLFINTLSGNGTLVTLGYTRVSKIEGVNIDAYDELRISGQSSTAGDIRILEGGLSLYAPLTVNSIQGDVICNGRSNIKNGKALLTINGNLEDSNVNFVLSDGYGNQDKTYPKDIAVCNLNGQEFSAENFSAQYAGDERKLAVYSVGNTVYIANCRLSDDEITLKTGDTYTLKLTGTKGTISGNDLKGCSWSSSDPAVATVNAAGTVEGISAGEAEIYANVSGHVVLTCKVSVYSCLEEMKFQKAGTEQNPIILEVGTDEDNVSKDSPRLIFYPADQAVKPEQIQWTSSNANCIKVENGVVEAIAASDEVITVTATVTTDNPENTFQATAYYKVVQSDKPKGPADNHGYTIYILQKDSRYKKLSDLSGLLTDEYPGWYFAGDPTKVKLSDYTSSKGGVFYIEYKNPDTGRTYSDAVVVKICGPDALKLEMDGNQLNKSKTELLLTDKENQEKDKKEISLDFIPNDWDPDKANMDIQYKVEYKEGCARVTGMDTTGMVQGDPLEITPIKKGTQKVKISVLGRKKGTADAYVVLAAEEYSFNIVDCTKNGIADITYEIKKVEGDYQIMGEDGEFTLILPEDKAAYYLDAKAVAIDNAEKEYTLSYKSDNTGVLKIAWDKKQQKWMLTPGKAGNAVITITAKDDRNTSTQIKFTVKDNSANAISLSTNKVTINSALVPEERYADIEVIYTGTVSAKDFELSLTDKDGNPFVNSKGKETYENIKVEKVQSPQNTNLIARISVESEEGQAVKMKSAAPYLQIKAGDTTKRIQLKVDVKQSIPKVTVKQLSPIDTKLDTGMGGSFEITTSDGTEVTGCTLVDETDYTLSPGRKNVWSLNLKENGNIKSKAAFRISLEGYENPVVKTNIAVKTTAAKSKLEKTTGTLFTDSKAKQVLATTLIINDEPFNSTDTMITDLSILSGDKDSRYTAKISGGVIEIRPEVMPKRQTKVRITLTDSSFFRQPIALDYTIKTAALKTAKLKFSKITLYSYENADLNTGSYTNVELASGTECGQFTSLKFSPADKQTKAVWNKQLVVYYDDADQQIKAYINGWNGTAKKSYKVNVTAPIEGLEKPIQSVLTVDVVPVNQKTLNSMASVKVKGDLDVYERRTIGTLLTTTFKNLPAGYQVEEVSLVGNDADLFRLMTSVDGSSVALILKGDADIYKKKAEVKLQYRIRVDGGTGEEYLTITSPQVNINLKQGKLKTSLTGRTIFNNTEAEQYGVLNLSVKNSLGNEIEINRVELQNYTKDFQILNENGEIKLVHTPKGETKPGSTCSLKVAVYPKTDMIGAKPIVLNYKVTIR